MPIDIKKRAVDFDPPTSDIAKQPLEPFVPRDIAGQPLVRVKQGKATDFDPEPNTFTRYLTSIIGGDRFEAMQALGLERDNRPRAGLPTVGRPRAPRLSPAEAEAMQKAVDAVEALGPIQGPPAKSYPVSQLSPEGRTALQSLLDAASWRIRPGSSICGDEGKRTVRSVNLAELRFLGDLAKAYNHEPRLQIAANVARVLLDLAPLLSQEPPAPPMTKNDYLEPGLYRAAQDISYRPKSSREPGWGSTMEELHQPELLVTPDATLCRLDPTRKWSQAYGDSGPQGVSIEFGLGARIVFKNTDRIGDAPP